LAKITLLPLVAVVAAHMKQLAQTEAIVYFQLSLLRVVVVAVKRL
jgi:hypothetical protein